MEQGAAGNMLFTPGLGQCLWCLRRILKEVKVCELLALWRKAFQAADSSASTLRHECAAAEGAEGREMGDAVTMGQGPVIQDPAALLGLGGHQWGSHSRVTRLTYV